MKKETVKKIIEISNVPSHIKSVTPEGVTPVLFLQGYGDGMELWAGFDKSGNPVELDYEFLGGEYSPPKVSSWMMNEGFFYQCPTGELGWQSIALGRALPEGTLIVAEEEFIPWEKPLNGEITIGGRTAPKGGGTPFPSLSVGAMNRMKSNPHHYQKIGVRLCGPRW